MPFIHSYWSLYEDKVENKVRKECTGRTIDLWAGFVKAVASAKSVLLSPSQYFRPAVSSSFFRLYCTQNFIICVYTNLLDSFRPEFCFCLNLVTFFSSYRPLKLYVGEKSPSLQLSDERHCIDGEPLNKTELCPFFSPFQRSIVFTPLSCSRALLFLIRTFYPWGYRFFALARNHSLVY